MPGTIVSEAEFDMFRATFGGYSYKYQEPVTETQSDYYRVRITRSSTLVKTTIHALDVCCVVSSARPCQLQYFFQIHIHSQIIALIELMFQYVKL